LVVEEEYGKGAFHEIGYGVPHVVSRPPGIRYLLAHQFKIGSQFLK
jgi:hypothetical protein